MLNFDYDCVLAPIVTGLQAATHKFRIVIQ